LANRGEVVTEHCLGFRLRNEEDERKLSVDRADIVESDNESLFRAPVDGDARGLVSAPEKRFVDSEIAQNLEASRVDDESSRFVGAVDYAIDDAGPHSEPVERGREHQAGWPRAHHQDIHGCNFVHRSTAADLVRATILRALTAE